VQCLTSSNSTPSDPDLVSSTFTAVDGTFTLANVPVNRHLYVVIQAASGAASSPIKRLQQFRSPPRLAHAADHTQGDIP